MFPFTHSLPDLIAVEADPAVVRTQQLLTVATGKLFALEAEEQRLIRLATNGNGRSSNADMDEAQRALSVWKGTQNRWFLLDAQLAREDVQALTPPYHAAVAAAKERLTDAGEAHLAPLVRALADYLREAQRIAANIEKISQSIGDSGAAKPEHPFPTLLSGGLLDWQLEKTAERLAHASTAASSAT